MGVPVLDRLTAAGGCVLPFVPDIGPGCGRATGGDQLGDALAALRVRRQPDASGRPIFTQRIELETALHTPEYTLPEPVDAPGLRYEQLDGEAEILPQVTVIPTPGHTPGHQSLIVHRSDGTVIVAGQSHDTATAYSRDASAWQAHRDQHTQPLPPTPAWIDRLQQLDPARVVFAHDNAVWEPAHQPRWDLHRLAAGLAALPIETQRGQQALPPLTAQPPTGQRDDNALGSPANPARTIRAASARATAPANASEASVRPSRGTFRGGD